MLVSELRLTNFRGHRSLRLRLEERLTLLVGPNGAGKSSVLDAIEIAFRYVLMNVADSPAFAPHQNDIRNGSPSLDIAISGTFGAAEDQSEKRWHITFPSGSNDAAGGDGWQALDRELRNIRLGRAPDGSLPLFVYYTQNRPFRSNPTYSTHGQVSPDSDDYVLAYRPPDFAYEDFVEWFDEKDADEARERRDGDPAYLEPTLTAVKKAVEVAMNFRIGFRNSEPRGLRISKGDRTLHDSQLSSGERVQLFLVADLARRLALLDPGKLNEGRGVVLIDEIELHLHPTWQRKILPLLLRTFPHCQFIVSTHSPQVAGEARASQLRILSERDNETHVETYEDHSYGLDSNTLLTSLFDTPKRSPGIDDRIEKIALLVEMSSQEQARQQMDELVNELGYEPAEVTIARSRLNRLAASES